MTSSRLGGSAECCDLAVHAGLVVSWHLIRIQARCRKEILGIARHAQPRTSLACLSAQYAGHTRQEKLLSLSLKLPLTTGSLPTAASPATDTADLEATYRRMAMPSLHPDQQTRRRSLCRMPRAVCIASCGNQKPLVSGLACGKAHTSHPRCSQTQTHACQLPRVPTSNSTTLGSATGLTAASHPRCLEREVLSSEAREWAPRMRAAT